jgi:magnesium transporter
VETITARLVGGDFASVEAIYVVAEDGVFKAAARLADVLRAPPKTPIEQIADRSYPRVGPDQDQEHAAAEALAGRATSVAVVDDHGRLVGAVPALRLLEILREEHVEDLHRLAGIQRERTDARGALEGPPIRRARHRLPWLLFGLAGSMIAASIMSQFARVLERNLAVAFFVPAIVYLADAIGTQTEAIVVRGLSLNRLPLRHMLAQELYTGMILGVSLAAVSLPLVVLTFGDLRLALSVAGAIVIAGSAATTIGLFLPWLFQRLGSDPAFGSGPVATIIQDVLSLAVYFALATMIVR